MRMMKNQTSAVAKGGASMDALIAELRRFHSGAVHDVLDELNIRGFMRGLHLQGALPPDGKVVAPGLTVQFRQTKVSKIQRDVHRAIDQERGPSE